ncbi:hypothetical protein D9M70_645830 [compost metagenome]
MDMADATGIAFSPRTYIFVETCSVIGVKQQVEMAVKLVLQFRCESKIAHVISGNGDRLDEDTHTAPLHPLQRPGKIEPIRFGRI